MTSNFRAILKKCDNCGEEYMPAHQSAKCPHKRLVDLMPNYMAMKYTPSNEELLLTKEEQHKAFLRWTDDGQVGYQLDYYLKAQLAKALNYLKEEK